MPKHSNRNGVKNRPVRREQSQVDPVRLDLLAKILEESSSIGLNDGGANQPSAKQALDSHTKLLELIRDLRQVESSENPSRPRRTEQSWSSFFKWIDAELVTTQGDSGKTATSRPSDCVDVAEQSSLLSCDNGDSNLRKLPSERQPEFALTTKRPLKIGDNIFTVHRRVMLSTETVAKDSDLFEFIKKDSIASAMQNVVLVLHLLNEYSKGDKSYWAPYLAILPSKILPVLTLDNEKLKCLLASSHLLEMLKMIRAIARQYSYFFKRLQGTNLPLFKDFTFDYYCWGVSIVCSRQNEIPASDKQGSPVVHALIPILDMCNHNRLSNQAVFEGDHSLLVASKELSPGDEITINYGCRSSGDFYIHNGFVPTEVPFDVVPLTIVLNNQTPAFDARTKLLRTLNMPTFGRFRLHHNNHENRHKRDPHLTMFLIVQFLTESELELIMGSDNPVGIADEIYEYVQYNEYGTNEPTSDNCCSINNRSVETESGAKNDKEGEMDDKAKIEAMKRRLSVCTKEYLSKRASVGIALIDRVLNVDDLLDYDTSSLLKHERSIYASHVLKCSAK